jgi:hypothetical protein
MLAHNVYFTLHDRSPAARARLLTACKTHLTGHAGVLFFACGELATDMARPVNDRDFDVALHLVFANPQDHDLYQDAPRHHKFVEENKADWARVRVFDSVVD